MTVAIVAGVATIKLFSNASYKGNVYVSFGYDDSPDPVPIIDPPSETLYVPCSGSVSMTATVSGSGWTMEVVATDGTQYENVTAAV